MQSSTAEPIVVEPDDQVTEEPAPTLIMLDPADDAEVCSVDGWCA